MVVIQRSKGRGAGINPAGRFEPTSTEAFDDGWESLAQALAVDPAPRTEVFPDASRGIIAHNDSPDIGFDSSINPYRGCEHGCVYCYARPSHNFLGLSSGIDFETKLFAKHDAAKLLRRELARPGYRPETICLGSNTDVYQPIERRLRITRGILEVFAETRHPVGIVTKSALILRDLDLLADLARDDLVLVDLSITTLEGELARVLEPRASAPRLRLEAVRRLAAAGVPVGVNIAPIVPALNDHEIERIAEAAAETGARQINYTLLRLPYDIKALFEEWLEAHFPERKARILGIVRELRGGRLNDPNFGSRMRGEGAFAELIRQRIRRLRHKHGFRRRTLTQRTDRFRPPSPDGQLSLF